VPRAGPACVDGIYARHLRGLKEDSNGSAAIVQLPAMLKCLAVHPSTLICSFGLLSRMRLPKLARALAAREEQIAAVCCQLPVAQCCLPLPAAAAAAAAVV